MRCPDDGTCHHDCQTKCYRVTCCGPLSGVYPNDTWPLDVRAAHERNPMNSVKDRVIAALREQATEAYSLRDEPTYSRLDCDRNSEMFSVTADWLADNWDDIVQSTEAL